MEIKWLYNAALSIESEGRKIIIDGIIEDDNMFCDLSMPLEDMIINRAYGYENIDALVFTHCHKDHFSEKKVRKIMSNRPDITLVMPFDGEVPFACEIENDPSKFNVNLMKGESGEIKLNGFNIEFFYSSHLSVEQVGGDNHYCIIIDDGRQRVLVTGDFEHGNIEKVQQWAGNDISCIYANPLILGKKSVVDTLGNWRDKEICIYHIPDENKEADVYRRLALGKYKKYKDEIKGLKLCMK